MAQTNTAETGLNVVVGVPPELGGSDFDRLIATTSELGVDAYLLDIDSPPEHFSLARDLNNDPSAPEVLYDGRVHMSPIRAARLAGAGIRRAVISGRLSGAVEQLSAVGIDYIGEPQILGVRSKQALFSGMATELAVAGADGRHRLFAPDQSKFNDMISALALIVNKKSPSEVTDVDMYVQGVADMPLPMTRQYIRNPEKLNVRYRSVIGSSALTGSVAHAREVVIQAIDAAEQAAA